MYVTVAILLLIAIFIIYWFWKSKYEYWKNQKVPHPKPTPFFGNLRDIILLKVPFYQFCHNIYNEYKNDTFVGFYNLTSLGVVIRDVDLLKEILIKHFGSFEDTMLTIPKGVDPILGINPACLKGSAWKKVRSQLTPQFTLAKLKMKVPLLQKVGTDLLSYMQKEIRLNNSNCFEIKELAGRYTGETVFTCAYGLDGKSFENTLPISFKIGEDISGNAMTIKIKHLIGLFFPKLAKLFKITFVGKPTSKLFNDIILDTIKYRQDQKNVRNDYLDYIVQLKETDKDLKDIDVVGHAFTFYLDSYETTAIVLTYLMYELALNPHIQEKCREEVNKIMKEYNGELTGDALSKIKYVENTIFETLRKHPPVGMVFRVCTQDFKVPSTYTKENNPVTIKKGTLVIIPLTAIHNDPRYYANPEAFNPGRFTNSEKLHHFPFGDGPRTCLGKNFAMLQLKMFITLVLNKYRVTINKKTIVPYKPEFLHVLIVPQNGIHLNFEELPY
ncbi:hypothetical protein FQA39_LY17836 [Lamprigera yunnana]|nr:hypothetical protein FQA39_LY17836 [Lamprigera yunnana]